LAQKCQRQHPGKQPGHTASSFILTDHADLSATPALYFTFIPASAVTAFDSPIMRDVGDFGDGHPLPAHPTSSQVIPDWRGLQKFDLDWRRLANPFFLIFFNLLSGLVFTRTRTLNLGILP